MPIPAGQASGEICDSVKLCGFIALVAADLMRSKPTCGTTDKPHTARTAREASGKGST